jgi:hypothetical protein
MEDANDKDPRHAGEWGLASTLMGAVLALMAPIMLLFNLFYWIEGAHRLTPRELEWARTGLITLLIVVWLTCIASVVCGVVSLCSAVARKKPLALATSGILLSLLALVFWLGVGIDLLAIIGFFRNL